MEILENILSEIFNTYYFGHELMQTQELDLIAANTEVKDFIIGNLLLTNSQKHNDYLKLCEYFNVKGLDDLWRIILKLAKKRFPDRGKNWL